MDLELQSAMAMKRPTEFWELRYKEAALGIFLKPQLFKMQPQFPIHENIEKQPNGEADELARSGTFGVMRQIVENRGNKKLALKSKIHEFR